MPVGRDTLPLSQVISFYFDESCEDEVTTLIWIATSHSTDEAFISPMHRGRTPENFIVVKLEGTPEYAEAEEGDEGEGEEAASDSLSS